MHGKHALFKPVLFLDFDRTLFDTDRFYEWLGEDRYGRILELIADRTLSPDYASYLYPDTLSSLAILRKTHRLVLLTYTVNVLLQRRKVRGSGIAALVDDVIISSRGKGIEAKEYLARIGDSGWEHAFVDDAPENIVDMKRVNPDMRVIRIARVPLPSEKGAECRSYEDHVVANLKELEVTLYAPPDLQSGKKGIG